jgi:hypothetical protein
MAAPLSEKNEVLSLNKPLKRKNAVRAEKENFLTEEDVPGAKIDPATIEKLTVTVLNRWLACRNLATKGNREEKVQRLTFYFFFLKRNNLLLIQGQRCAQVGKYLWS